LEEKLTQKGFFPQNMSQLVEYVLCGFQSGNESLKKILLNPNMNFCVYFGCQRSYHWKLTGSFPAFPNGGNTLGKCLT